MGIKKIRYIPANKLSTALKEKYGIKSIKNDEFAQIRVTNPAGGVQVRIIKSPLEEVRKAFKKKSLEGFQI
ncbi:MAG: hypothetical protein HYT73_04815 [Candidatus Aenigmarchaeota archaeon]|nr:hypothetical protein [Candidatus Aenigmarchaeota archaeon]